MTTYFQIRQIDDKKNPGNKVAATYKGRKIGFCYNDLKGYGGLYEANAITEKEKFFRFSGRKVSNELPPVDEVVSYMKKTNASIRDCHSYNNVLILRDSNNHTDHFITSVEGNIVSVEPFEWFWIDRRYNEHLNDGVRYEYDYVVACRILSNGGGASLNDESEIKSLLARVVNERVDHMVYYPMFNAIAMYCKLGSWLSTEYKVELSRIFRIHDGIVMDEYLRGFSFISEIFKKADKDPNCMTYRYTKDDIKEYMRDNFIGMSRSYWSFGDKDSSNICFCDLDICGRHLRVFMYNRDSFDPKTVTEEERALVEKSKKDFDEYRKALVKGLGVREYTSTVASKLTLDSILSIDKILV